MTHPSRTLRAAAALLATGAVALTAACTGGSSGSTPTHPPSSTTSSHTSHPKSAHHKAAARNPYTGLGPVPKTPTIAVKIDDTAPGRPQVNIDRADVVYIEAAEGGLTRLAAVFGTTKPKAVGYVRSTRPSDPDLLLQYGKITEAYSGGAHDSLPRIHRSGITSWSQDDGAKYYHRANRSQSDYINVVLNVAKVAKTVKSAKPKSIGWTFSPTLKGVHAVAAPFVHTVVTGSYAYPTGTPVDFRWDPKLKKYVRYIDGRRQKAADGKPVTATNVIVQYCRIKSHPQDTDVNGNPSQFTYTTGKGKVLVFRNARRVAGTWSRPKLTAGTTLHLKSGKRLPLMPGNTWVILDHTGVPTKS